MGSVRFYLEKRKDANGLLRIRNVPILAYFSFEGNRLQLSTGERIDHSDWDFERQRANPGARGSKQLNRYLDALAEDIQNTYREARTLGISPGISYLKEQLRYRRRKENIRFFDVFMRFIDENYNHWSLYTFRKIKTTYNHLRRFAEAEETDIQFNRIDHDFMDRYVRFFQIKYRHSNNTISKNLDVLRWFLNWAGDKGYNKSTLYKDYRLSWPCRSRVAQNDLVLEWDELMKIRSTGTDSPRMAEVRDIFCFMCFTGLKLSRVNVIKTVDVFPTYLRIVENSGFQNLPINNHAYEIARKYTDRYQADGNCFPFYTLPDFNRYLKKLGREAGISNYISIVTFTGTEKAARQVPKYEILSSKIAVNTFLLNALTLGITPGVLSFVTGSKTQHSIERIKPLLEEATREDIRKFNELPAAE